MICIIINGIFSGKIQQVEKKMVKVKKNLKEIGKATETLSQLKFGALIAIEKSDPLASYLESGVMVDAKISGDLIEAIFTPNNPLHDGAVIIQNGRIMAAGCLFPLSENQDLSRIYGTRHRAALGLSEETDTLVIIVSEERKDISLVYKGRLFKEMGKEEHDTVNYKPQYSYFNYGLPGEHCIG